MIRVITPPQPIVTPADIAGSHAPNDPAIAAMIAAATGEIDGPYGYLKRSIGKQTLEIDGNFCGWWVDLRLPPIIKVVKVFGAAINGIEAELDASLYYYSRERVRFHAWQNVSRIQYEAGFSEDDGTGPVPPQVKQAIILSVQHMKALSAENLFLRSEDVEGVGSFQYTVSDQAGNIIRDTCRRLLAGLKVPRT
ncbi:hypothetical protein [Rhizobium sp. Leaf383]|uniref:hypothetical protein n=1 Tax=Rhizobium sp. Leaf383 TaxID=1736357 RepID=UPI00071318BF|nr:hypothetical protein [Rhizobium sp. Leaf383]KQS83426.1 hypothetical protein ASG58_22080 [Rhizobium sp. Leaf383]